MIQYMAKHSKKMKRNMYKRLVILLLTIIFICSTALFIKTLVTQSIDNSKQEEISQVIDTIDIPSDQVTEETTERMLQVAELKKTNSDIIGWLEITGTNISYPVLQGQDNEYYLNHSYTKEKVTGGSLFLDKDYKFYPPSENLLIYGHRNTKGLMFEDLIKYKDEAFYKEHPSIRFTTVAEDTEYEIISAFKSRVYAQNETNVFRYYDFVNAESGADYNEYVNNVKQASLYNTGKMATFGDQLLTLSTCDYEVKNGRFAVVAKKIK